MGQTLRVGREQQTVEIVAVMPNALLSGFRRDANPNFIFRSEQQEPGTPGETTFYIRYAGSLNAVAPAIGRAVREVDPKRPDCVHTDDGDGVGERQVAGARDHHAAGDLRGRLAVDRRHRPIRRRHVQHAAPDAGFRPAHGPGGFLVTILGSVLGEGFRMTMVGLFAGCLLSLGASMALRGLLYGVSPTDAPTHVGVFVLLAAASLAACYLPARRATRIDPMQALRQE